MQHFSLKNFNFLSKEQQKLISKWCFQILVLGCNSGKYDLNLIKKCFVTHIAHAGDVKVANKQNKVMFMSTPMSKFLDI